MNVSWYKYFYIALKFVKNIVGLFIDICVFAIQVFSLLMFRK